MTNLDDLNYLYQRISILEITEKLKGCGVTWTQVRPAQYRATVSQGGKIWDLSLSKNVNGKIILDFRRDGSYFFSVTSDDNDYMPTLYEEVEGDENFQKDQELLKDISGLSGCS